MPKPPQTVSRITFAATVTAVSCARMFAGHVLDSWHLAQFIDDVQLIASELVTNAVKATGVLDPEPSCAGLGAVAIIGVQIRIDGDRLYVEVWDSSSQLPVMLPSGSEEESGRGLLLVEMLSNRWGVYRPESGGKIVWAELWLTNAMKVPSTAAPEIIPLPKRVQRAMATGITTAYVSSDRALMERLRVDVHDARAAAGGP